jgi:hypothetical protein
LEQTSALRHVGQAPAGLQQSSEPPQVLPSLQLDSPGGITVQALPMAALHSLELPAGPGLHFESLRHVPNPAPGSISEPHSTAGLPSVGGSEQVPNTAWLQLPTVRTQLEPLGHAANPVPHG